MKGAARMAASAALTAVLAAGCLAPGMALADPGTDTGTITITASAGNDGVAYYAYKLFTCDVDLQPGSATKYAATNIDWPSAEMRDTVENAIHTYDHTYPDPDDNVTTAQDAADYLMNNITGTSSSTRVPANGLAENLTKAVIKLSPSATLTAGETSDQLPEGYYLIVSQPSSVSDTKMGTAPIFTMLGNGQNLQITEKTSVPTLAKTLIEDSAPGEQRSYADAHMGQDVTFELTGTVPDSIGTFTTYYCKFEDTLPEGMDLTCADGSFAESDVTVQVALDATSTVYDVDPSGFEASYAGHLLTVEIGDLTSLVDTAGNSVPVDPTARIVVSYQASLNSRATVGAPGNTNRATLTYSNNPQETDVNGGTTNVSTTVSDQATVYEYQLDLYKYDKAGLQDGTKKALSGATFTIQATGADDDASKNKYVQSDGTLDDAAYGFTTDSNGLISVKGLDAGTYTLSETDAPSGYEEIASDLTLTITPNFWAEGDTGIGSNAVGSLKSLSATLAGGNGDSEYTKVDADLCTNGTIAIQVSNRTPDDPPDMGLLSANPAYLVLVSAAGIALFALSLAALVRRQRKART